MKKFLILMSAVLILCPKTFAGEENIALLTKKGFFERPQTPSAFSNPYEEVRKTLNLYLKYANNYDFEGLKSLYADNYVNSDGFNKAIYCDLVKKTWTSYPDIKYKMEIKNIEVGTNSAVAQISECAYATTNSKSGVVNEKGILESNSNSVYYLERFGNEWLITSDHILSEKTSLKYGNAKYINVELIAPSQIPAGTQYTSTLQMEIPKESLIIASIGKENITYPQATAQEVFRKLPKDGTLERLFKANEENINEYAVASFGITKAEIKNGTEIKIYVTGLGFVMSRVNVIPKNNFVKATENEKAK